MSKYDKLTQEELLKLVEKQEKELKNKKYGLVWDSEKEPEKVVLECENNIPILQRIKEKEIKTDESEDNILIEGDNYHALTVLNYTHKEKIDVIYIDPPYNTGNKDFIYNDKYVDKEDGYRHSKWLNFMEKRLTLANNLLKYNGVIFISIDDNEESQLKLLCDKIFGQNNFVSKILIQSNPRGSQASNFFATTHEYVLVYAKDINYLEIKGFEKSEKNKAEYAYTDKENQRYRLLGLRQRGGEWKREQRPNMYYPIYVNPKTGEVSLEKSDEFNIQSLPKRPTGEEGRWTWSKEKFIKNKHLLIGKKVKRKNTENFYDIFRKDYLKLDNGDENKSKPKTIWINKELNYQNGRDEIKEIFGEDLFDYPKPTFLIKQLVKITSNNNSTILDFFAGSGTTGHAVLELNKEDGGNRKFILCTNNENNICEEVTYPRIQKVIQGYEFNGKDKTLLLEKKITFSNLYKNIKQRKNESDEDFKVRKEKELNKNVSKIWKEVDKVIEDNKDKFDDFEKKFEDNIIKIYGVKNIDGFEEGLGGNLQYFRTDLIPVDRIDKINDKKRIELTEKAGQMIAIKENTFEEVELNEWFQIFESKDKKRRTAIYFREDTAEFETLIDKIKDYNTTLYIFSYGRIDKKLYNYLGKNIRIEDIPEPILEIYKEINLTIKEK